MNTPSHFIITAALGRRFSSVPIITSAFLLGSVAPDLPLYLLCLVGWINFHLMNGWSNSQAFRMMFDHLFFQDPVWIASHNFLHSPLLLGVSALLLWRFLDRWGNTGRWSFWFVLACLLHTAIDIPVHVTDGPLLLFPINWQMRFHSSISYWDPRYHGSEFMIFELGLDAILSIYLTIPYWQKLWSRMRGQV